MRNSNQETLKQVLKQWMSTSTLKPKLNQVKIQQYWEKLMGPTITSYTKEIFLNKQKLFIYLESAALRQELSFGREKIKRVLNEELGEEYIKEVIIR
ncbi:MAG: DUF721 domain-containing protein [Bacteroidota bacterium]